uniref:RNase H type-1 domain-containing protein n=1 Tax=Cannabis sativa TaxID=3483 RepID=A0A803PU25_CANSA
MTVVLFHTNRRLMEMLNLCNQENSQNQYSLQPPPGWTFCNTDIAIGDNFSVGAAIFRNDQGRVFHACTKRFSYSDALAGEVAALSWGAESAKAMAINNIVFLSDLAEAVKAVCCSKLQDRSTMLHHNIQDLVYLFLDSANLLGLWEASWIPRTNNGVAHSVAKWALDTNQFGTIDLSSFDSSLLSP